MSQQMRIGFSVSPRAFAFRFALFLWARAGPASAQPTDAGRYPTRPIRVIVPLAPGGPADLVARTLGQKLTEAWGQQVIADNRAGVNGVLGSELVAKSAPDGYTLLMGTTGTHGINASLYARLPYDTVNDFAPIARGGISNYVLVAHPSLPARDVKELIRLAKTKPATSPVRPAVRCPSLLPNSSSAAPTSISRSCPTKAMHSRLRQR